MASPVTQEMRSELERRLLEHNIQTAQVLGNAVALRDSDTGAHNFRVALYAGRLGEAADLDQQAMRDLIAGAFLHDLGKIAIPDAVLLKPGPLSDEERRVMCRHSDIGAQLLSELPAFRGAIDVVRHHHERFDGTGYPDGLMGTDIPLVARAFSIVDVFDALMSDRPYKRPFDLQRALEEIATGSGTHFDPDFTAHFLRLAPEAWQVLSGLDDDGLRRHVAVMRRRHFGA